MEPYFQFCNIDEYLKICVRHLCRANMLHKQISTLRQLTLPNRREKIICYGANMLVSTQ